ncbi:MAG: hypothetical protein WAK57_02995 [Desulfobacterales bacterium]
MISGRDTLREIDQHIHRANAEIESAAGRLEGLTRELNAIRVETAENFRQLARFRLDDLKADRLIGHLDEVDRTALGLLEKHREVEASIGDRIEAGQERQRALEKQRQTLQEERDAAGEALEERLRAVRARIGETEAYRQQKAKAEHAADVARKADQKASQAENDRAEKGRPYEEDSLFKYLWDRRYLTPDYRANPISRLLDGWVAGLLDFRKNRVNYHMLLEIPVRLRAHAARAAQTVDLEIQALETLERQAAEADGVPGLQKRLDQAEEKIHVLDDQIEQEEEVHRRLLAEREKLDAGEDGHSKQAFELILAELQREDLFELYGQARSTPRPEDDAIVTRIGQARERAREIEAEVRSTGEAVAERRKSLVELEALRRRFRRSSYDAYDSGFSPDLALSVLLGKVLGGLMGSDRAWQEIGRNQRRRGSDFGGFGGPARSGRGGFSRGGGRIGGRPGGFGGGGFRTGGRF